MKFQKPKRTKHILEVMNTLTKILLGTGVVVTGGYLLRLGRASANIESELFVKVHSVNTSGVIIRVDAKLKNPTDGSLKFKYPFINIYYNNVGIATSQAVNEDITLPKYGEANINNILIRIPIADALSVSFDLIKSLLLKKEVKVNIQIATSVYTPFSSIPFHKDIEKIIKNDGSTV